MGLLWGVRVFHYDSKDASVEQTVQGMVDILVKEGLLEKGDPYITTLSIPANKGLKTNTVQLGIME